MIRFFEDFIKKVLEALLEPVVGTGLRRLGEWPFLDKLGHWSLMLIAMFLLSHGLLLIVDIANPNIQQWQMLVQQYWWWGGAIFVTGAVSVIALVARRPDTYWIVAFVGFALWIVSFGLFLMMPLLPDFSAEHAVVRSVTLPLMCFAFFLVSGFTILAFLLGLRSQVPIESPLAPLVYFGRHRHMRALQDIARQNDWRQKFESRDSAISFLGDYKGRLVGIETGYRLVYRASYIYLSVSVYTLGILWPFRLTTDSEEERPDWSDLNSVSSLACHDAKGELMQVLVLAPDRQRAVQAEFGAFQKCLDQGRVFLVHLTKLEGLFHEVNFERRAGFRMTEDRSQVEALLDWLVELLEVMERAGLRVDPMPSTSPVESKSTPISCLQSGANYDLRFG